MVTLAVIRQVRQAGRDAERESDRQDRRNQHPKMKIVAEGGEAFTVPFAPRETTLEGITPVFAQAERGGREPLLLRGANGLPQITFDLVFGHPNPNRSIERELRKLRSLAKSGRRMRVKLDPTTSRHLWRLTSFSQQVFARQHGTNNPTRAVCSLTFQKASDAVVAVGPVSGGAKNQGRKRRGDDDDRRGAGGGRRRPRSHVVARGETLSGIALEYYGEASGWRRIADANKIRHPNQLRVGQKLTIP